MKPRVYLVTCPTCGLTQRAPMWRKLHGHWLRCIICGPQRWRAALPSRQPITESRRAI